MAPRVMRNIGSFAFGVSAGIALGYLLGNYHEVRNILWSILFFVGAILTMETKNE